MSYQALYRRYRPRRFGQVRGQDHIVTALRNSVRENRVGHAYLFSGPRGTGKTTTARILAKALNCEHPQDGEPDLECASCVAIEAGTSFDVHELDAASHNRVDDVRELLEHVALSTPGRTKLYVLDEVHMLTPQASAALLKTLEEPPPAVVFILATTDPQKVLPTIRSRAQHFEFHLLPAAALEEYVRSVVDDAGLDAGPDVIERAVRDGNGSARDALSALEQLVAAGGVAGREDSVDDLITALVERDTGRALVSVVEAMNAGRDPRLLCQQLVSRLRDVFLAAMKGPLDHLGDADRDEVVALAEQFERPFLTRCIESLGDALTNMPEAVDQRIVFETALVRLTNVEVDVSPAAMLERLERLERIVGSGAPPSGGSGAPSNKARPADAAREALKQAGRPQQPQPQQRQPQQRQPQPPEPQPPEPQLRPSSPAPSPTASATQPVPSREELTLAWGDAVMSALSPRAKSRFQGGRFIAGGDTAARFALPNETHRKRCDEVRSDVEAALSNHFGRPVPLVLVIDDGSVAAPPAAEGAVEADVPEVAEPEAIDVTELVDAPAEGTSSVERLTAAFPGAEMVQEEQA